MLRSSSSDASASVVDVDLSRRRFLVGTAAVVAAPTLFAGASASAASPGGALPPALLAPDVLTGWTRATYDLVKAERVAPPAAARIYAHVALAGYEAIVAGAPHLRSLAGHVRDLPRTPVTQGVAWQLAASEAMAVAAAAAFADRSPASLEAIAARRDNERSRLAAAHARGLVSRSVAHGSAAGASVAACAAADGYAATRGLAYEPPVGDALWVRTPPNFGAAIEPFWGSVRPFALAANDECKPVPPVPFSTAPGSAFMAQAMAVYDTSLTLDDAQRLTALFWRDNPDGSTGLPSGHWMLTACTVVEQLGLDLAAASEVLALTAIAIADGFTSCWTEKYETNLLRPVTYIKRHIDPDWSSFVNSPAFPEYTSGHSVGSGAAAAVLTALLGEVAYDDDVGVQNGYPIRRFPSFAAAAEEAAVSRLYGGIHYPMAIEVGLEQGHAVAAKVLERLHTRRPVGRSLRRTTS